MGNNGGNWDKNFIIAVITLLVSTAVAITIPELRRHLGLEADNPVPQLPEEELPPLPKAALPEPPSVIEPKDIEPVTTPTPQVTIHQQPSAEHAEETPWAGPVTYTLQVNQPQFIDKANTTLSIAFHVIEGEQTAGLTIAPAGKAATVHAVLEGYTEEFTSPAGQFLVTVLNIDWKNNAITVQVSPRSE